MSVCQFLSKMKLKPVRLKCFVERMLRCVQKCFAYAAKGKGDVDNP